MVGYAMSSAISAPAPVRFPYAAMVVLATIAFTAITTELLPSGLLPQINTTVSSGRRRWKAALLLAGFACAVVALSQHICPVNT